MHTYRCQPVTTVREPFCSQFFSLKIRSKASVSFTMLKAEKAWVWQTPQTLIWEDCFAAAVWRVTASRNPVATRNQVACSSSEQEWSEHWTIGVMLEARKLVLVPCLASCASWCGVHAAIQFRAGQGRHAGVSQWPLCENHPLPSFHPRKGSDQWRVCPWQWWKLRKFEFGRHLRPCVGKILGCWCCHVTASREQEWAGHWTNFTMLGEQALSSMSEQSCQLMWHSCSNPVHINHQQ